MCTCVTVRARDVLCKWFVWLRVSVVAYGWALSFVVVCVGAVDDGILCVRGWCVCVCVCVHVCMHAPEHSLILNVCICAPIRV